MTNRLDQATYWTSGTGRRHRIASMPDDHADNAAGWLISNAVQLLCARELELNPNHIETTRLAQILANPAKEMASTTLYKALRQRADGPSRKDPR